MQFRQTIARAVWAIKLSWVSSPRLTFLFISVSILRSFVPAGLVLVTRYLINGVASKLETGGGIDASILVPLVFVFLFTLIDSTAMFAEQWVEGRLSDQLGVKINMHLMEHASMLDLAYFEQPGFRDILERARENISMRFTRFVRAVIDSIGSVLQVISLFALVVVIDPIIIVLPLLLLPPYLLYMWRLASDRYQSEYKRTTQRRWTRYYMTRLLDVDSAQEVRLLGISEYLTRKFRELMETFHAQNARLLTMRFIGGFAFVVASSSLFIVVFYRVIERTLAGLITIGDVAVLGGAVARLAKITEGVANTSAAAIEEVLYVSNLKAFYELKPAERSQGKIVPTSNEAKIELKNVSFTYPNTETPILKNISLVIEPKQTIALVGENGAGKTTLAKLIARIYDPTEGVIELGGVDLRDLSSEYLYRNLSFVFQNFGRYEGTVAENLAYGNLAGLLGDQRAIEELARHAGIDEMIRDMPNGYDTQLGRQFGEYDLSGGQWQRLAVARAFARDASLLILDEPTSSLDAAAEYELFRNFKRLAEGKTAILISHRFTTVGMADRILVLDSGEIIEDGSHAELIALDGHYAHLYHVHHRLMRQADHTVSG